MSKYVIPENIFWIDKISSVQIVKTSDDRIFKLEGLPASVFLSIVSNEIIANTDEALLQKVLEDLENLNFIQRL
jgi:hypothetical protein